MSKQIITKKETVQYLSDVDNLRDFIVELQQHLKERVFIYQENNGELKCSFSYDPDDGDIPDDIDCYNLHDGDISNDIDWIKCFIGFCNRQHLNWTAAYKTYSCFKDGRRHRSDSTVNHEIDDKCDAAQK